MNEPCYVFMQNILRSNLRKTFAHGPLIKFFLRHIFVFFTGPSGKHGEFNGRPSPFHPVDIKYNTNPQTLLLFHISGTNIYISRCVCSVSRMANTHVLLLCSSTILFHHGRNKNHMMLSDIDHVLYYCQTFTSNWASFVSFQNLYINIYILDIYVYGSRYRLYNLLSI